MTVDFEAISIEEIEELKMKIGWGKHGDPLDTDFFDMFMRFLRYYGEFLVAVHIRDHKGQMEALADIKNGCTLLFPHIQDTYIRYKDMERADPNGDSSERDSLSPFDSPPFGQPPGHGDSNRFE